MSAPVETVLAASALTTQSLAQAQATGCGVLVKVLVSVSTGTVDQALDQIRDGVDGSRNTLAKLADVVDAQADDILRAVRRTALIYTIALG